MEVKYKIESQLPVFSDVKPNQFFISEYGCLFQKIDFKGANQIASKDGYPNGLITQDFGVSEAIQRVLPEIETITFD